MAAAQEGGSSGRANTRNENAEHVAVHPQYIHSNATCHRWAFGAIAEMVDNAVAEIQNGATVVRIDRIVNPRNNEPALLVADNGGGMNPHSLHQSMAFPSIVANYSYDNSVLGHYQNGLKATAMRLGADAVVFTVCPSSSTASVGLLSYTFLVDNDLQDSVVPILNYNCISRATESASRKWTLRRMQNESNRDHWNYLLETILSWSPYSTEGELLDVLYSIRDHGTQIVVYNLWRNNDGETELDFESCGEDIQIRRSSLHEESEPKKISHFLHQQHIANRFPFSLRAYLSILYLRWPGDNFSISLRGRLVEHYDMSRDMKLIQIKMCPLPEVIDELIGTYPVVARIGFVKEAPLINIKGFNLYYKDRLIVPFWRSGLSSELKGIVGFVNVDILKPAPGKQEFEKSPISAFVEGRLIQMSNEFWKCESHMITYGNNNETATKNPMETPITGPVHHPAQGLGKIVSDDRITEPPPTASPGPNAPLQVVSAAEQQLLVDENRNLKERLHEFDELKEEVRKLKERIDQKQN